MLPVSNTHCTHIAHVHTPTHPQHGFGPVRQCAFGGTPGHFSTLRVAPGYFRATTLLRSVWAAVVCSVVVICMLATCMHAACVLQQDLCSPDCPAPRGSTVIAAVAVSHILQQHHTFLWSHTQWSHLIKNRYITQNPALWQQACLYHTGGPGVYASPRFEGPIVACQVP
jgi:hypothetical protein